MEQKLETALASLERGEAALLDALKVIVDAQRAMIAEIALSGAKGVVARPACQLRPIVSDEPHLDLAFASFDR